MTDVAKLVFEFDATSATKAEAQIESLEKASGRLDQAAARSKSAFSGGAFEQARTGAVAYEQSLKSLAQVYGVARDSLGRFTKEDGAFRTSQEATALMMLRNAAAAAALAKEQDQAAKTVAKAESDAARSRRADMDATATLLVRNAQLQANLAKEQEQAAAVTAGYAAKFGALKAQLDPFAAVQLTLAQRTKLLDEAMAHGAITADQHAAALSQVTRAATADVLAIDRMGKSHVDAAGTAKQLQYAGLNMGRQFADIGTQLGSGQGFGIVLIQQGPQILDIFAQLKAEGIGFKAALAGIAAELAPFLVAAAPWIALAGAIGAVATATIQYQQALAKQQITAGGLGRLSGLSARDLEESATAIAQASDISIQAARKMAEAYSVAGVTSVAAITDLGRVTKDLEATMGLSGDAARDYVAAAMHDPAKAATELQGKLGLLSASQLESIQNMQESGNAAGAQRVLMDALSDSIAGASDRTGGFKHDVGLLVSSLGDLWDWLGKVNTAYELYLSVDPTTRMAKQVADAQAKADAGKSAVARLNAAATNAGNLNLDGSDGRQKIGNQIGAKTLGYYGALGTGDLDTAHRLGDEIKALTRAKETYLAPAERAAKLADLEVRAATAKTLAQKVDIAQEREKLNLAGVALSKAEAARKVADAGRVAGAQAQAALDKKGAGAAGRAVRADNRGDNAIEQAKKAELTAQMATTKNVETIAGIKAAQIAQELTTQKVRLAGLVEEKRVTAADAETALTSYERAAGYKQQALDIETANQIANRDTALRSEILGYTQRTAQLRAAGATSLEAANEIENQAMAERQAADRDALEKSTIQRQQSDGLTQLQALGLLIAQKINQTAETAAKEQQDRVALIQRSGQIAQAGYQNDLEILQSQGLLATTIGERRDIELEILKKRQASAIRAAQDAVNAIEVDSIAKLEAINYLNTLKTVHANQLKSATGLQASYNDVADALSAAADAFDNNNWAAAIINTIDAFNSFSKTMKDSETTLESKVGAIAALAAGVGRAVGGTAGAGIVGAASGALAGAAFAGSKLGTAIAPGLGTIGGAVLGGLIGGIGSLLGSSSNKKRQREQEAAERAAEEAQRLQTIADTGRQLEIDLLRAQGKEIEAVARERENEIARLTALSPALAETQKAIYVAVDAEKLLSEQRERAAKVAERAQSIQDQIDEISHTSAEQMYAGRVKELAAADALDTKISELLITLWGLQDAASATAKSAQEAADAFEKAQAAQTTNIGLMRQLNAMDDAVLGTTSARDADRADELAKLDTTGKYLKTIIWARQDEAEAVAKQSEVLAKQTELLKQRTSLENQILRAIGTPAALDQATKNEHADTLKDLDPSLRAFQSTLWGIEDAVNAVTTAQTAYDKAVSEASRAYEKQTSDVQATVDKFKTFSDALRNFRSSLNTGGLAMNDPLQQYGRTKSDFERVAGLAAQGNEDALGQLQGVSEAYLEASKASQATNVGYFRDLSAVKRATEAAQEFADKQVDTGTAQLKALEDQFKVLGVIADSSKSIEVAIADLADATRALANAKATKDALSNAAFDPVKGVTPTNPVTAVNDNAKAIVEGAVPAASNVQIFVGDSADAKAAKALYLGGAGLLDAATVNKYAGTDWSATFQRLGYAGDWTALRRKYGFQSGGSFEVGGSGGPDSQFMPLHLSPGEMVNVQRPGQSGSDNTALIAEMRALRAEVAALRKPAEDTATNTKSTHDRLMQSANGAAPLSVTGSAPATFVAAA